ncbi:hypothetical protein ES319_D07G059200v1 [Gossypium barbadense]|uniref:Uncharacterized protein n=1 Tax=Gossypium barbadense TaxID=3634 RepID=A0A5J5QPN1_GOSBA|nr:hypothetical protein ES319_D07G059200v1 [Gossypium barbadense]KAB2020300.1 hypothetical protein ES319_D07G059200v1 [Gossypium barbadense]KAB2020301.1 hypothetical protein ES319_D07G059200v1 [Gossypium barbadense]
MIINKLSHLATVTAAAVTAGPPLYRLLKLTVSRFHGAAQPQPDTDYWYYYHVSPSQQESCRDELFRSTPVADTNGSVPLRGVQWAFIGSPRAKKRVYAVMLSKLLEVPHITMASLVRQELSPNSNLYKQVIFICSRLQMQLIMGSQLTRILYWGYCRRGWKMGITEVKLALFWMEFLDHGFKLRFWINLLRLIL